MGYERGVQGSIQGEISPKNEPILKMNENGLADKVETSSYITDYFRVKSVICIKKVSEPTKKYELVNTPLFQGKRLSSKSSLEGVCKILGFKDYLQESMSDERILVGDTSINIDPAGNILGAEIGSSTEYNWRIEQLVCIKNE